MKSIEEINQKIKEASELIDECTILIEAIEDGTTKQELEKKYTFVWTYDLDAALKQPISLWEFKIEMYYLLIDALNWVKL